MATGYVLNCIVNDYPTKNLPREILHYKVQWEPSRENEEDLKKQNPALQEAVRAYYANKSTTPPPQTPTAPISKDPTTPHSDAATRGLLSTPSHQIRHQLGLPIQPYAMHPHQSHKSTYRHTPHRKI
jgi:hypothetical protein